MRNSVVLPAPFNPNTNKRSPLPKSKSTLSKMAGPLNFFDSPFASITVIPQCGGSGKRTFNTRSPSETSTLVCSIRAMRFSMLCAIAALVAFAPNLSTTPCKRSISFCCVAAFFASRASSAARDDLYCVYVPRYSINSPTESSCGLSKCSTRVIASSNKSKSWLMTNNAPR